MILASGSGTRHRPLAGGTRPVAFQADTQGRTVLERTVARLSPLIDPRDMIVVTDRRLGQSVRSLVPEARIVLEPVHRDTAAAIALAAVAVERADDEPMLVEAADHDIDADESYRAAVGSVGEALGQADPAIPPPLFAFTVPPTDPEPGFSYVRPQYDGVMRLGDLRVYRTDDFEAHPDARRTQALYETGTSAWSAGIYVWQRGAILAAIERYTPLLTVLGPAYRSELALKAAYDRLQALSIDEAVLVGAARDGHLVTSPLDVGWREAQAAPA